MTDVVTASQVIRIVQLKPTMDIKPKFLCTLLVTTATFGEKNWNDYLQDRALPHTGQIYIVLVLIGWLPLNLLQDRSPHLFQLILSHGARIEIDRSQI